MKRTNLLLALTSIALPAIALATYSAVKNTALTSPLPEARLTTSTAPVTYTSPKRVITQDGFLYENFESVPDSSTSLPDGWITVATPGLPNDCWHVGTLGRDGTPLNGVSGYKYAYILGNRENNSPHDAWMFSPTVRLEAGKEYNIEFFTLMPPVTGSEDMEKLRVCVCNAQNKESVVNELDIIENDNDYWRYNAYTFTPSATGDYCIGFNSLSPANSNSTVIDDLKISSGPLPIFSASTTADLGTTDTRQMNLSASYRISNGGTAPLTVSFKSASEGVTVSGLPQTLDQYQDQAKNITISAVTTSTGDYEGYVVLETNDPTLPTVTVNLSGSVLPARVTGYNYENFEKGDPEGWKLSYGSGNVSAYGGHNSARAYYTTTMYWDDERNADLNGVGFTTHYVDMGTDPKISFWYQIAMVDFSGNITGAADSSAVKMNVLVSEDNGMTYTEVYALAPDADNRFNAVTDWQQLTIPVPQYAGKTCRVRVIFNHQGSSVNLFNQMRCMVDDVELGTKIANDMRATSLTGNALLNIGQEQNFYAEVENLGSEPMSDYKVELINTADGKILNTANGVEVNAGAKTKINLKWTPDKAGYSNLAARIVSDSDPVDENNTSYSHHVCTLPVNNSAISINHGEVKAAMAFPINFYAVESATQTIYPANEIGATEGVINSIVFKSYLDADFYGEPFEILISETDLSDFSDGKFIDPDSFTKVFEGSIYMQQGTKDVVIPFNTPYNWNGKNIAVMCRKIGKEFIYGKYFVIHECKTELRSIQTTTFRQGELDYNDAIPVEVYPEIRFNVVKPDAGKVQGTVKDSNGAVEGALVRIKNTQRTEITDANGNFSFNEVAAGDCFVEVSKHGYYILKDESFNLNAGSTAERNITLTMLPRYTVTGTITSAQSNQPIMNARVTISGYDNFTTFTDNNGQYSIDGVAADSGSEYDIAVFDSYFKNSIRRIDVNGNKTIDFSLDEVILRPFNPKAINVGDDSGLVTWQAPLPEFRYDSGIPSDYIGWTHGNEEVIVGTVFHKKARIKEVSWYATNRYGAHSNFNVIIFGLDEEGNPNPQNILYVARNVEYKDNEWSSHILGNPVEADGFMVAISCTGFMGIGICEPSDEFPFEDGQCYYAGDSFNLHISPMSTFAKVHPMLRAYGDDLENANNSTRDNGNGNAISRPAYTYKVYRVLNGETTGLIATTNDESFFDSNQSDSGNVCYDIVASYASGNSEAARSNTIVITASVSQIFGNDIAIGPNPMKDVLTITGNEYVRNITFTALSGIQVLNIDRPEETIDVSNLSPGIYIATLTLTDHKVHTVRIIKQ